jgi:hypothetical protein
MRGQLPVSAVMVPGMQHIITSVDWDRARPIAARGAAAIAACSRCCRQVARFTMRPSGG